MHTEQFCTTETPQKIMEISWKCHGKSRKITENHGRVFFQANHGNGRSHEIKSRSIACWTMEADICATNLLLHFK